MNLFYVKNIVIILIIKKPNCSNCKISGDCTVLNEHWQHCILYNCDACAFRDNFGEICSELLAKDNILLSTIL